MSDGLLDFFVLEASECAERMDFLLARSGSAAPDLDAFARNVRALRGSATMSRVTGIAELASALERVVRGLRDGSLHWGDTLRGAVIAAVDDTKVLVHGARAWGPSEAARAAERTRELNTLAPAFRRQARPTPITASGNARFLADETASVAAGLQSYADSPGDTEAFEETLSRVRALRGVAALSDLPPLAEVVAAVDDAARSLGLGRHAPNESRRELFRSAAAVLREGSDRVHHGGRPNVDSPAVQRFTAAAAKFIEGALDTDYVVPIGSLFPDATGDHDVRAAARPPTTPPERFRLEVVSHAEHLRRLVSDARHAVDPPSRQRLGHELRVSVRSLWRSAESFGEHTVAGTLHSLIEGAGTLDSASLAAIDEAARLLTAPSATPLRSSFASISTPARSGTPVQPLRAVTPAAPHQPYPPPVARAGTPATPIAARVTPRPTLVRLPSPPAAIGSVPLEEAATGPALRAMLGAGLAGLASLDGEPLSTPIDTLDQDVVPIEALLYRKHSALRRAVELGDEVKRAGDRASPGAVAELFDLLSLAASE